jgi:hypothetical protein
VRFPRRPGGNAWDVQILAGVFLLVIVAVMLSVLHNMRRGRRLRRQFGPEYTRLLAEQGDREVTELELHQRMRRHEELPLRPLSEEARDRYAAWLDEIEGAFDADHDRALAEAETLVVEILRARGYPAETYQQSVADISVDDPEAAFEYRAAFSLVTRESHPGGPSEQQLRTALMHYQTLVHRLLAADEEFASEEWRASPGSMHDRWASREHALNATEMVGFEVRREGRRAGQVTGVTYDDGRAYLAVAGEGDDEGDQLLVAASDIRDVDRDNQLVHLAPGAAAQGTAEQDELLGEPFGEPADRQQS